MGKKESAVEVGEFKIDDLIFAKLKGYPYWPARVQEIEPHQKPSQQKFKVQFYGTYETTYLKADCLVHFNEDTLKKYGENRKLKSFNDGIWEIQNDPELKRLEAERTNEEEENDEIDEEMNEAEPVSQKDVVEEVVEGMAEQEDDEEYEDVDDSHNSDEIDIEKQSTDSNSSRNQSSKKSTKSSSKSSSKKNNKKSSKKESRRSKDKKKSSKSKDKSKKKSKKESKRKSSSSRGSKKQHKEIESNEANIDDESSIDSNKTAQTEDVAIEKKTTKKLAEVQKVASTESPPANSDATADENIDIEGGIDVERSSKAIAEKVKKSKKVDNDKKKKKEIEKSKKSKKRHSKSDVDQGDLYDDGVDEKSELPAAKVRRVGSTEIKSEPKEIKSEPKSSTSPSKVKAESSARELEKRSGNDDSKSPAKADKKSLVSPLKSDSKTQISQVPRIKPEREQLIKRLYVIKTEKRTAEEIEELKRKWQTMTPEEKDTEKIRLKEEKVIMKKIDKVKSIKVQLALMRMDIEIKKSLKVDNTDVDRCCLILQDLNKLPIVQKHLFNAPEILETIKKCRKYQRSEKVKQNAQDCFMKFTQMFSKDTGGETFTSLFENERGKYLAENEASVKKERELVNKMLSFEKSRKRSQIVD